MLFRPEVANRPIDAWIGEIHVARSIPSWIVSGIAIVLATTLIAYGFLGTYARKARVSGILVSQGGELNIVAPLLGKVTDMRIREGQAVGEGEVLLVLDTDRPTESADGTRAATDLISKQIDIRRNALAAHRQSKENYARVQKLTIESRLRSLDQELEELDDEIRLQKRRRDIAATSVRRYEELAASKFMSAMQVQQQHENLIDQDARLKSLERMLTGIRKDRETSLMELRQADVQLAADIAILNRELASLAQEGTENTARRSTVITATRSGTVSAIAIAPGQTVSAGQTILAIQPEASLLEAHLFAPTRTVGFIREGQQVLIRYAAFPYQKFGLYQGSVATISQSAFAPNELPPAQQVLFGKQNAPEALYRVTVTLGDQEIAAFGRRYRLRPGMALEADIVQEKRTVVEWLLEPLFAFSQRL